MSQSKNVVDRSGWLPGPWDTEPDRAQWDHLGLDCLMVRNRLGAWCGYVGVPETHPAFGKGYDDLNYEVHGGLTYANECAGNICHEGGIRDRVWWLGFDCAHAFDLVPGMQSMFQHGDDEQYRDVYRDMAYVKAEVEQLAEQLAAHGAGFLTDQQIFGKEGEFTPEP